MNKKRILIIDDDEDLSFIMSDMLEEHGYEVSTAESVEEAYERLGQRSYHLLLLDINLPDGNGYEICQELRKNSSVPVIFASARSTENDRIAGFEIGGDDYLPKPYSMRELLVRVAALLRRTYGAEEAEELISFGNVRVNLASRSVTKDGKQVNLALREFDLLEYMIRNRNKAIPKDKLLSEVWGSFNLVEPSTLTVHIRWLREKLEDDPASPVYFKTVRGTGYMLEI